MLIESSNQSKLHADRQKQLNRSSDYINSFLKALEGVDAYQSNNCPTCGSANKRILFVKNGGEYAFCSNCEHVYLSKSFKPEYLIDFYSNYPTSSLDWHKNESEFYTRIYNSGLDMIQGSIRSGSLLDIGCSSGFFLSIAAQREFSCCGVEPNSLESSYAKDHGINILGRTLSDLPSNQRFDVITMWDVLEHIDSPSEFISDLKSYLNPGGIVFVQIPTCDSIAARIMREKCNMFDGIEHLTLFSRKSLDLCFSSSGFAVENAKSVISDSFALNNYLSYEADPYLPSSPHHSESFLQNLIEFDSIESNFFGYKIQACYKEEAS